MSSLAHDRLLPEGPAPRKRAGSALATAGGTRTRRVSVPAAETNPTGAATPRRRTAQRSEGPATGRRVAATATKETVSKAARTAATATRTARAKAAETAASTVTAAKATAAKTSAKTTAAAKASSANAAPAAKPTAAKPAAAKPAAAKPAAAKPAARKPATAKPATAKPAAAKPAAAKSAAAKPAAAKPAATKPTPKPAAAKSAAAKPAVAEPATPTTESAPARRPRPTPRTRPAAPAPEQEVVVDTATVPAVEELEPATGTPRGRRIPSLLRHRRRALVLAAAVVAVLGVGSVSAGAVTQKAGAAEQPSHSRSVAAELGIPAKQNVVAPDARDADRLAELTASRATREELQAAAVQAQQQADAAAVEAARPQAVLPVNGARLTTCFCMRWGTMHWGIDLAAPMGTPEYAAMDGVVLQAGPASGFGLAVYIQHANGDVTVYGHMEQILVTAGQVVKAGDEIALLGSNGQSTGPHLHFEVHVGGPTGQKVDPIPWLAERGVQVP